MQRYFARICYDHIQNMHVNDVSIMYSQIFYNIGRLASLENDNERATQYYLRAIELYSDYDAALMNLGNLYRIKNNLELAEKYISKSVRVT